MFDPYIRSLHHFCKYALTFPRELENLVHTNNDLDQPPETQSDHYDSGIIIIIPVRMNRLSVQRLFWFKQYFVCIIARR